MAKYYGDIAKSAKGTCVRCVVCAMRANVRREEEEAREARASERFGGSSIARDARRVRSGLCVGDGRSRCGLCVRAVY